jgi:hypothetical protein
MGLKWSRGAASIEGLHVGGGGGAGGRGELEMGDSMSLTMSVSSSPMQYTDVVECTCICKNKHFGNTLLYMYF